MTVDAIGAFLNSSDSPVNSSSGINEQDFIKLFVSELQFQDPMQPLDNSQFLTQLAQFVSIQQQSEEVSGINNLLTLNSQGQPLGLLAHNVQIGNADGTTTSGKVTGIQYGSNGVRLTVMASNNNVLTDVTLSQIQLVTP
ncbi:MAG: flagellar hook capping FlgD N-terminal domain-containing protein [Rhodanobacter sp.]